MSFSNSLEKQLEEFRGNYYQNHQKNTFFKESQKNDCAKKLTQQFSLVHLLEKSIYSNKHVIFFNYPLIKTFMHPGIYSNVISYIDNMIEKLLQVYNVIDIHVDMDTFTMTAAQRYNDLIKTFCSKYLQNEERIKQFNTIYIQNSPSVIEVIRKMFSPFMSPSARDKLVFLK